MMGLIYFFFIIHSFCRLLLHYDFSSIDNVDACWEVACGVGYFLTVEVIYPTDAKGLNDIIRKFCYAYLRRRAVVIIVFHSAERDGQCLCGGGSSASVVYVRAITLTIGLTSGNIYRTVVFADKDVAIFILLTVVIPAIARYVCSAV